MNHNYCVIMAGGLGSRFWPLSRETKPKQFIDVLGVGKTFIRQTYERFLPIVPVENFLVVTNTVYRDLVLSELPELKENQILCEPVRRNTAPCILYAAHRIASIDKEAVMIVTPSDHLVLNQGEFQRVISNSISFTSSSDSLMTIGLKPSRPETGYGYIQIDDKEEFDNHIFKVKTFTEKPNVDLAKVFVESGEFFWNSGIFIWSVNSILNAAQKHISDVDTLFCQVESVFGTDSEQQYVNQIYPECRNVSIDYGIMEHADNVYVSCADFGWSDIGTWGSLYQHSEKDSNGNAVIGDSVLYDCNNSIINMPKGKIAIIEGLDNYIVVENDGMLLVCRKEREQDIRSFVDDIKHGKGDYIL